jgi:peroxiredoxin
MIAFELPGTDGQVWTRDRLHGQGEVAVHFIKKSCPVNAGAMTYFKRLAALVPGRYVGVFDGCRDTYEKYRQAHGIEFPCILDSNRDLVAAYGVLRSPTLIVFRNADEVMRWESFSEATLAAMADQLAAFAGSQELELSFAGAPMREKFG